MPNPAPDEYPGNSKYNKPSEPASGGTEREPRRIKESVVSGEVKQRNPEGIGHRIKHTFFAGADARSVGHFVMLDIIVPAIKTMLADSVSRGAERMLFGDVRPRAGGGATNYTSYNRVASPAGRAGEPDGPSGRELSRNDRATHNFSGIVIADRSEAENVIASLEMVVDQYNFARVSDLYDLVGITGNFTDDRWGWNDLSTARTQSVRGGWLLVLPQTIPLN